MKLLITGGAGYLGSVVAKYLSTSKGHEVILFDRLSSKLPKPINSLKVIKGDITNISDIDMCFENETYDIVVHIAGVRSIAESINNPDMYYQINSEGTRLLLKSMRSHNINRLIFFSSSEVYGNPQYLPIDESHPLLPVNPYGLSKKKAEEIVRDFDGVSYIIMRLANVCGAYGGLGDLSEPSYYLVTNAVKGALGLRPFTFTCGSVNTPDHTPIRDYVSAEDVAEAVSLAANKLIEIPTLVNETINIGSGIGYSALEIVNQVKNVTGVNFESTIGEARPGEVASKYLAITNALQCLHWSPKYNIKNMIESSYSFYQKSYGV